MWKNAKAKAIKFSHILTEYNNSNNNFLNEFSEEIMSYSLKNKDDGRYNILFKKYKNNFK